MVNALTAAIASVPVGMKDSEIGPLPTDWSVASLSELCAFENGDRGFNYPSKRDFLQIGVPFVNAGHLQGGKIDFADMDYISQEKFNSLGGGRFVAGDVLYCLRGSLGKFATVEEMTPVGTVASSLVIVRPNTKKIACGFLKAYFGSESASRMIDLWAGGAAQPNLGAKDLARFAIALPPTLSEQQAIATALADADALIEALESLIAKKRAIKQGAMQELLSGHRRLPGFDGQWKTARLGEIAHIKTGSRNNQDKIADGDYPFFVRSETVERINTFSYDCEAILVPGEGGIGSIFHYINGRFDAHQRVYVISRFSDDVVGRFIHLYMTQYFGAHAMQNTVKATVDSLRLPTFQNFHLDLPPTRGEQQEIAQALSDIDEEISALTERLSKARQVKKGMMQELLTGRVRLV